MTKVPAHHALRETAGAVYIEFLIAFIPVMAFFVATWEFIDLCAADLLVKRAASAAARAAVVVMPDDPHFYPGSPVDTFTGGRAEDIRLAASMILGTMCVPNVMTVPSEFTTYDVHVEGKYTASEPLTATVTADFYCGLGWASIVCGGASRRLTARATYAYQGAGYSYDL